MSSRLTEGQAAFLAQNGWDGAALTPLAQDASTRAYVRLQKGRGRALLMIAPPSLEAAPCPPEASPSERQALGYNAQARLAGPDLAAFVCIAENLTMRGFSAPRILAADRGAGLALLEDLGGDIYAPVLANGGDEKALYMAAAETLAAIYRSTFPDVLTARGMSWPLLPYDALALQTEADLLLDWYGERHLKLDFTDAAREDWRKAWAQLWPHLSHVPAGLILRDFHAENLFWLSERQGQARVGLIDFQDGLLGHPAYDLVSLLEDARRDVAPDLAAPVISHFCEQARLPDIDAFIRAYDILGAQRNAKILGIFVRLAVRDGKQRYLDLIPRVHAHFLRDLRSPALSPVKDWLAAHMPQILEPVS